jgi:hypothetical protein
MLRLCSRCTSWQRPDIVLCASAEANPPYGIWRRLRLRVRNLGYGLKVLFLITLILTLTLITLT